MLGVSVETLRRWETDGRLRMTRSDGGQRLVEIDEVARLLGRAPQGRNRPPDRRPVGAQPVPRDRHADRARPRRGRRRGHRRSAPAGQPHDRRGRRGARPQGRRRGGLRRQGDQRHRRDPVVEGVASDEVARSSCLVVRPRSSSRPARAGAGASVSRATRHPTVGLRHRRRSTAGAPVELTIYGAASLKGALETAKAAYEAANPARR